MRTGAAVLDCDCYKSNHRIVTKIADWILLIEHKDGNIAVFIEAKSGRFDAREVIEQLKSTLEIFIELLEEHRIKVIKPIILHGRMVHSRDLDYIKRRGALKHHKLSYPIDVHPCGMDLTKAIIPT